jgi:hypothetical protein
LEYSKPGTKENQQTGEGLEGSGYSKVRNKHQRREEAPEMIQTWSFEINI